MKRKIKDIHQIMIDESPKYEKNNDKKCQKKKPLATSFGFRGVGWLETEIFTNIKSTKQMMQIEIPFLYNTIDTNKDTTLNTNDKIIQLK